MSPPNVRDRVTLASLAVLAAGLVVISATAIVLLRHSLNADANKVLGERAAAQLAALTVRGDRVRPNEHANDAALDELSWVFVGRREIERPHVAAATEATARRLSAARQEIRADLRGRTRLLARPLRAGGRRLGTIVVGVPLEPYVHTEHLALLATAVLALFLLVVGALVARRAVGTALRPVAEMSARAADWSAHDLHRRFGLGPPRDEISGLAATLDGMLARIDAALRHEQRFSAEIAHELRTPLSGVRAEVELALRDGTPRTELRAALERVLSGTDRMAAVVQTLLATQRNGTAGAPAPCSPREPVDDVVEAMRPAAGAHGVRIAVHEAQPAVTVVADPDMIAQAFQPLLDNAIGHARAAVAVRVEPGPETLVIAVEDDGAGLAVEDPELVFAPGRSTTGGAGLGLPLARRLARSMGGDVAAAPPRDGGARFELRLPRA